MKFSSPIAGCMRWGAWGAQYTTEEYTAMINACLENGITCFDHADIYGDYTTEAEFGAALKNNHPLRRQIKIITKCGIQMMAKARPAHEIKSYNTSREHIIASAEKSLKNFHTDYLDVLLIHRPDPLMNPEEVAAAVLQLKSEGKILHFGVSNFLPHQMELLKKFVSVEYNQMEISILHLPPFTNGLLDYCLQNEITPMAWAPLGGGVFSDELHPRYRAIKEAAAKLAEKYSSGINEILIAFLLTHPSGIVPVVGTTKIERLIQAREANNILLNREDWFLLYSASLGEDVP